MFPRFSVQALSWVKLIVFCAGVGLLIRLWMVRDTGQLLAVAPFVLLGPTLLLLTVIQAMLDDPEVVRLKIQFDLRTMLLGITALAGILAPVSALIRIEPDALFFIAIGYVVFGSVGMFTYDWIAQRNSTEVTDRSALAFFGLLLAMPFCGCIVAMALGGLGLLATWLFPGPILLAIAAELQFRTPHDKREPISSST
jgi:hypothetical protein